CGLYMAQMELNAGKQNEDPVALCGKYPENPTLQKGLGYIFTPPPGGADRFALKIDSYTYYNIYGIERLGRFSGQRFLGPHDWYREGCLYLIGKQKENGSWYDGGEHPTVSTSFAILF